MSTSIREFERQLAVQEYLQETYDARHQGEKPPAKITYRLRRQRGVRVVCTVGRVWAIPDDKPDAFMEA
jgi:hypothetical protein